MYMLFAREVEREREDPRLEVRGGQEVVLSATVAFGSLGIGTTGTRAVAFSSFQNAISSAPSSWSSLSSPSVAVANVAKVETESTLSLRWWARGVRSVLDLMEEIERLVVSSRGAVVEA